MNGVYLPNLCSYVYTTYKEWNLSNQVNFFAKGTSVLLRNNQILLREIREYKPLLQSSMAWTFSPVHTHCKHPECYKPCNCSICIVEGPEI